MKIVIFWAFDILVVGERACHALAGGVPRADQA